MSNIDNEIEVEFYHLAVKLLNEGQSSHQIKKELVVKGLNETQASSVIESITKYKNENKTKAGNKNILYGAFWFIGGIVATAVSEGEVLFYGAIIAGAIQLIMGLVQSSSND